jgi:hypothetical protein
MKKFVFLLSLILFCFFFQTSAQGKTENQYANIPTIDYCEITKNPTIYNEKTVKIFAEHRSGFEFSALGIQNCVENYGQIWVEWEKNESCGDEKTARLLINRNRGIEFNYLQANFVGKFFVKQEGKSGFGHMNANPFKLVVSCVESATLLPKENSGCVRVDETTPFHYLEYVKTELGNSPNYENGSDKKRKEKIVWFRLANNSSCPIIIPTLGSQKELQNEEKTLVVYKLDPTIKDGYSEMKPRGVPTRMITENAFASSILAAGNSIYFAVPLRYFKKSFKIGRNMKSFWNISVPFQYANRKAENNYEPFYFAWTNLPKEIFKK